MKTLKKSLKLLDVIAICVGAMFSSGFFLLPGLAFAHTGPSVFLAYALSGLLIIPSMLSQAELSTAMPKAGGTYFFLDRAFGPVIGTLGGLGTFLGLVLKTAFALIGFGAYLQLYMDVPIKTVAGIVAVLFLIVNLVGAKESGKFQKVLVSLLVFAMAFFIIEGLRTLFFIPTETLQAQFSNFFANGFGEFFYTIAFVFVSYAGLTKIASVAEEIENPDRNIPLGMFLSLLITIIIYSLGVAIVVALVPTQELLSDLKPIATAETYAFDWIKGSFGQILVALAALAAFASTGNAGILASSRYPLAMAKDKLIPRKLAFINRFGVPGLSIVFTGALILLIIFTQSEEGIAKFASAFQLLLFILINLAVIVMRESKIKTYDPGYKTPWYPWTQCFGIIISFTLLIYMGTTLLLVLTATLSVFLGWFYLYASKRVVRKGAIYHWFARLGEQQFNNLESELWTIMKEKGTRKTDPTSKIISEASVVDVEETKSFLELSKQAADILSKEVGLSKSKILTLIKEEYEIGGFPITGNLCMAGLRFPALTKPKLLIMRCPNYFTLSIYEKNELIEQKGKLILFLLSSEEEVSTHLRLMANWVNQAETNSLVSTCILASTDENVRKALWVGSQQNLILVSKSNEYKSWIDQEVRDLKLSEGSLIVMIIRDNNKIVPTGKTIVKENDQIIIISDFSTVMSDYEVNQ